MNESRKIQRCSRRGQRGGFAVGLVIGLLIGLALALGVALYVTKVPVPFVNKVPQRTAGQDAAEAEKNKNWDPNSPLYGKNPAKSASGPDTPPASATNVAPSTATAGPIASAPAPRAAASSTRDPAAILADRPASAPKFSIAASGSGADPFSYFVQAGAYARTEDAEQQRAKLAMMGMEGKLTERDQSGRTVYRVRVGPFDRKGDADAAKDKLAEAGIEAALVRVQR
jgi:cell division protein FtsN